MATKTLIIMVKKTAFFFLMIAAFGFFLHSCKTDTDDLWDSVYELDGKISSLEELCKQMNSDINSLQTLAAALQDNNSITSVIPVMQDEKIIGYTISFVKGDPIIIRHGEKGEQGNKGNDGATPVIGIKQYTDGLYYWTLGESWLRDNAGNMIKAEGKNGKPGEEGKTGVTPQLKIEDGYWWVSYGEDSQWIKLDKAIVDNEVTVFEEVTQDDRYVYFTLKDGTVITIQKYQKLSITFAEGSELIFDINETKVIHYTIKSDGDKNVIKTEMLNDDNGYSLYTNVTNSTSGTITITSNIPTTNQVIVSVSDGEVTIMTAISLKRLFKTVNVVKAGTLWELVKSWDDYSITALKVTGSLNSKDIFVFKTIPQFLAILDLEETDLTELPKEAFYENRTLQSVIFPKALKKIGERAFMDCCGLKGNLILPSTITDIGDEAFKNCRSLTGDLVLPPNITHISSGAFENCLGFTKLTLPPGVTVIGSGAFQGCNGFTDNLILPSSVTSIEPYAFGGCSSFTGDLVIPSNVTIIGRHAFYGCSGFTGSLTLPSNLTTIGEGAFSWCSGFTGSLILPPNLTTIGEGAFEACSFTGNLILPSSITTIGRYAFNSCTGFVGDLVIPSNVTVIEESAFANCMRFTSLVLPSNVTTIERYAFDACSGLTSSLTLPPSITLIGERAFGLCYDLSPVYCGASNPPVITAGCFQNTSQLYVPLNCARSYKNKDGWREFESIYEYRF